jgi:Ca2+/H+ antiporter, TMEM165/GDT1 family
MDLKLLLSAFASVFVAELGDKTQLATLSLASGGSSRWSVFLGASLALIASTAIAVLGGELMARTIPPHLTKRLAGIIFIILGVIYLWNSREVSA